MSDTLYIAKTSFATHHDGSRVVVRKGITRVREGHPLLKKYAENFEPIDDAPALGESRPVVEDATAEPGRKRGQK